MLVVELVVVGMVLVMLGVGVVVIVQGDFFTGPP